MKRESKQILSTDQKTQLNVMSWLPEGEPWAIMQVAHGMVEYMERYDRFGQAMAEAGVLVVGNDHLGHGDSVESADDWGFFAEEDGNELVLQDIRKVYKDTRELFPDIPYFLLGHSMGSFYARQFIYRFPEEDLAGVVIMGTSMQPEATVRAGRLLSSVMEKFRGPRYRSPFIKKLVMGANNKIFKAENNTGAEWLSRDQDICEQYVKEPRNTFLFTTRAYIDMFDGLLTLYDEDNITQMRRDLPILITSGSDDPVGEMGKAVANLSAQYEKIGMINVKVKEYPDARHELLNELNAEEVDRDLLAFMKANVK
ncbi:MAG: alpha/beta hydrolase [Eubacteriales bacterium]|nr:alpha/beta hydrolase [Eubacteriales bacterium]MDD4324068.1 alpha/beta hydrolase [Eubacteriales bacterium]MDD4541338.1 alpha/beta hydrolase [Eubacteriales bacterium]